MAVLSKMKTLLTFLPLLASASPVSRRATLTPVEILNYALTLEHLEATFYRTGVANFTAADFAAAGYDGTVYDNFLEIAADEKDHVDFLTTTLQSVGGATVPECVYSFPVTDVKSFVAVAGILEGVGASAYLGAAKDVSILFQERYAPLIMRRSEVPTTSPQPAAFSRSKLATPPISAGRKAKSRFPRRTTPHFHTMRCTPSLHPSSLLVRQAQSACH